MCIRNVVTFDVKTIFSYSLLLKSVFTYLKLIKQSKGKLSNFANGLA